MADYGVWLVLSTILTFGQVGTLGISSALSKLIAEEYANSRLVQIARYQTTATTLLVVIGSLMSGVIWEARTSVIQLLGLSGVAHTAYILLPYVTAASLLTFLIEAQAAVLIGISRMDLSNISMLIDRLTTVTASAIFLYHDYGVSALGAGAVCGKVISLALLLFLVRQRLGISVEWSGLSKTHLVRLISFGGGLLTGSLVNLLLHPFNRLVITRFAGPSAVPGYDIAFAGSMTIRSLFESALKALVPEISRSASSYTGGMEKVAALVSHTALLCLRLSAPLYLLILLLADRLLELWLGTRLPHDQANLFRWMLLGSFVSLWGAIYYYVLVGLHKIRAVVSYYVVQSGTSLISVLVNVFLFQRVSVRLVIVSTSVGMIAAAIYAYWTYRNVLRTSRAIGLVNAGADA